MKKFYPLFGILAPIIYIAAVFVGGLLRQDYSPLYNTISELSMTNAPNLLLMDIMFGCYNLFLIIFSIGAYIDSDISNNRNYKSALILLIIIGVLGLATLIFTQDPRGAPVTLNGTLHIILSGITALLTILSVIIIGLSFRKYTSLRIFSWYSYINAILIFISGGVAATAVGNNSAYGGLFERITIFLFMIWLIIFSYVILRFNRANT